MCPAPAPAEETPNPYEAYYLEQAAMLSVPDQPAAPRGIRRDLESFRLSALAGPEHAGADDRRPRMRPREVVTVVLAVVILLVIPLVVAALYWRSSTSGN